MSWTTRLTFITPASVVLAALAAVALVGCQQLQVSNLARIPPAQLTKVEQAVQAEMHAVHAAWGTPDISFGASGWPVIVAPPPSVGELSHHTGAPAAYVWTDGKTSEVSSGTPLPWTVVFSHEVLEMIANPSQSAQLNGWPLEIADPVLRVTFNYQGVQLEDFILPAWFGSSTGPWDYAHALHGPYQEIR